MERYFGFYLKLIRVYPLLFALLSIAMFLSFQNCSPAKFQSRSQDVSKKTCDSGLISISGDCLPAMSFGWKSQITQSCNPACDSSCSDIYQTWCESSDGVRTNDSNCSQSSKPASAKVKVGSNCNYAWKSTLASNKCSSNLNCDSKCIENYTVVCIKTEDGTQADESKCNSSLKPKAQKIFSGESCSYTWITGNWSTCTPACGQSCAISRDVICQRMQDGSIVEDSKCLGSKPKVQDVVWGESCPIHVDDTVPSSCVLSPGQTGEEYCASKGNFICDSADWSVSYFDRKYAYGEYIAWKNNQPYMANGCMSDLQQPATDTILPGSVSGNGCTSRMATVDSGAKCSFDAQACESFNCSNSCGNVNCVSCQPKFETCDNPGDRCCTGLKCASGKELDGFGLGNGHSYCIPN